MLLFKKSIQTLSEVLHNGTILISSNNILAALFSSGWDVFKIPDKIYYYLKRQK
jgi:hypothetical protein